MGDEAMQAAMRSLGWDPDSDLPMANAVNLQLLQEIQQLTEEKEQLLEKQEEVNERIRKLEGHAKIAKSSIEHNLTLLTAYQMEALNEVSQLKVVKREHGKYVDDIKSLKKENEHFKKFTEKVEAEIGKMQKKMENETNRIKWAKTALSEWQNAMEAGNRGFQLIEKYFKEDQQKAFETDQKRSALDREIAKVRKEVINLYDEQKTLEQTMECTAALYRSAHNERRQMVETWKAAVSLMTQRENDIVEREQYLTDYRNQLRRKQNEQKNYDNKLNEIIANNRDTEQQIEILNSSTSEMREEIQNIINDIKLKENELDIMERELQNLAHRVQQQRMDNKRREQTQLEKEKEVERMIAANEKLEQRLANMAMQNMNAQQRLEMLEEMNTAEEKVQNELNKETQRINGLLFRAQQQLADLKSDQKINEVEYDGLKSNITAVDRKITELERDTHRLTEANYDLGFKILQIERSIIKIKGGVVDPEEERKNLMYLAELEEQHGSLQKRLQATELQNKKLDDSMRALTVAYNRDMKNLEEINYKIKEAEVYCEGGVKRLKNERNQYQMMIVDLSILKMKANEFEKEILRAENCVYNLEKHRVHLNRVIKDRMVEIRSQMDLLFLKKKHLNEERSTLRADIGERRKHIDAVRARFELTAQLLGTNEDGTLVTATQLRVQHAQDKQMLLDEGNAWNERVLRAEREIKAMENTVILINKSNDNYRRKVEKKDPKDQSAEEIKELQMEHCKAVSTLKTLRQQVEKLLRLVNKATDEKEHLERDLENETRKKMDNLEVLNKLEKEVLEQKQKLQRAERELRQIIKTAKQRPIGSEFLDLYQKDLDLRDLEYRNMKALNQLCDLVEMDDDLGPHIATMMHKRGFKMTHQMHRSRSYGFSSLTSEMSMMSSRSGDDGTGTGRSSFSGESALQLKSASASISVVSLDFPEKKLSNK